MIKRLRALRLREEAGYNLVEMLTVMMIMSVVFAGITTVFVAGSNAQAEQDRRFQAQVTTRLALDKIRRDIHCATDVTPFTTNAVTLKIPTACGGDVSWCTSLVSGYTNRYRLYRQAGTSCSTAGTKIADYLTCGVDLVWVIDPEERHIAIYRKGREFQIVRDGGEVTGEDVLPGLAVKVSDCFLVPCEPAGGKS